MLEEFTILQNLPSLEVLFFIFLGTFFAITLGAVFLLLFFADRNRAQGMEINFRRKFGHECPFSKKKKKHKKFEEEDELLLSKNPNKNVYYDTC